MSQAFTHFYFKLFPLIQAQHRVWSINRREYEDLVVREDTRATVRPVPTESAPLLGRKQPPADNQAMTKITEPGGCRENLNRRNTPGTDTPKRKKENPSRRGDSQASCPHLQLHINHREVPTGGRLHHHHPTQKNLKTSWVSSHKTERGM